MITQDELDALPIMGAVSVVEKTRIIHGRKTVSQVPQVSAKALHSREDDPLQIQDRNGRTWLVGWCDGVRYKQQIH